MDETLLNKLSNLTLYGFYDPSKDMVMVHFFNKDEQKSDIIAYLKRNMSWDVREIIKEKSKLLPDKEIVEIEHNVIGIYNKDSKFDLFIRSALLKTFSDNNPDKKPRDADKMFRILEDGKYDD